MQEIAADSASAPLAWSIRQGRLFRFAPAWAESPDRVTFDACSGDYWVLDALGYEVVSRLLGGGTLSTERLSIAIAQDGVPAVERNDLEMALERLAEAGLIQVASSATS